MVDVSSESCALGWWRTGWEPDSCLRVWWVMLKLSNTYNTLTTLLDQELKFGSFPGGRKTQRHFYLHLELPKSFQRRAILLTAFEKTKSTYIHTGHWHHQASPHRICRCLSPVDLCMRSSAMQGERDTEQLRVTPVRCSTLVRELPALAEKGMASTCTTYLLLCHHLRNRLIKGLPFFFLKREQGSIFRCNKQGEAGPQLVLDGARSRSSVPPSAWGAEAGPQGTCPCSQTSARPTLPVEAIHVSKRGKAVMLTWDGVKAYLEDSSSASKSCSKTTTCFLSAGSLGQVRLRP